MDGNFPFHRAAKDGDLDGIVSLYSIKPSYIESVDGNLWTPLHWACHKPDNIGNLKVIKWLMEYNCNINASDAYNRTPLLMAARNGNIETVKLLLESNNILVDTLNTKGETPLFKAIQYSHKDVARLLLLRGANPSVSEATRQNSPLHAACANGNISCLNILLKYCDDINIKNIQGNTPLHICILRNRESCAKLLISSGADMFITNNTGKNPVDLTRISKRLSDSFKAYILERSNKNLQEQLTCTPVESWTTNEVNLWLNINGFQEYANSFRENDIDGRILLKLDEENLKSELGVQSFGHRARIVRSVLEYVEKNKECEMRNVNLSSSMYISYEELIMGNIIGKGYFGQVRKAKWNGIDVAVKNLYRDSEAEKVKFDKEIQLLSSLRHPNIVSLIGWSISQGTEESGSILMITEYLSGGTLHWLLRHSADYLSNNPSLRHRMIMDITKAMRYLHGREILHRDLNSKNVLITEHYECKLSDFGLSRTYDENSPMTSNVGFLICMAPEVYKGEDYTYKADVYSFGILIYFILTGQDPQQDMEPLQFAYKISNENYRPSIPSEIVKPQHRSLIETCWSSNPDERPTFHRIYEILSNPQFPTQNKPPSAFFSSSPSEFDYIL
eukprot:TRINITY_DN2079_c0_g1_i1.p1 TRINITY_DN2079_c0_g1~~TRINITY_DN2079_c0_g1_i1.p1  ORF type:complete len:629 (-),score=115.50 TRINITY_DN2079_c0_g1_i1:72-1925(-)